MREIKFRVWSGNMWLDGGDANIHPVNRDATDIELVAAYPHRQFVMCQYTGLTDRNGVEIYEGDILAFGSHETNSYGTSLIKWSEGAARFYQVPSMAPDVIDWRGCEVIGNIYENPELSKDSL